jgi:predicted O-linked N-acetylglucosamine transferase (SPINDLY family)
LNGQQKYNPTLFDLWCRILIETPDSVLWLSEHGNNVAEALRREVAQRGVQPARLIFAQRVENKSDHQARIALADLGLDPFPYNSHSTGIDLLWAGVPLVALRGNTFAGRVGASMLMTAGLELLVAQTPEQYLDIAVGLYHDRQRLSSLRAQLREARESSALFDMAAFTRNLESIYMRMWQDHRSGRRVQILADQESHPQQLATDIGA